jgi:hypothetical protein
MAAVFRPTLLASTAGGFLRPAGARMPVIGGVQELASLTGNRNWAARRGSVCSAPRRCLQAAREAETPGFEQPQRSGFWGPVTPVIRRIPCTAASHLTRAATAAVPLPRTDGPRVQPIATRPSGSGGPWVPDRRGAAYQRGARAAATRGLGFLPAALLTPTAAWPGAQLGSVEAFTGVCLTVPGWCVWVASWSWSRRIPGRGSPLPPLPGSMRTHPGGCRRWAVRARPGKRRWGGCMSCWCASRGGRSPGVARA